MERPDEGWLWIGQLAAASGVSVKALRFYGDAGVLVASGRYPAGYRLHVRAMIERVGLIRSAQAAGLSLGEIAGLLEMIEQPTAESASRRSSAESMTPWLDCTGFGRGWRITGDLVALSERGQGQDRASVGRHRSASR